MSPISLETRTFHMAELRNRRTTRETSLENEASFRLCIFRRHIALEFIGKWIGSTIIELINCSVKNLNESRY